MTDVFGFILLVFTVCFWGAIVICGVGFIGLFVYALGAAPFIIYRKFFKETV